ncbi:probable carboxylesterase 18 [Malania oleifera]|uniref:probable carboxylesterase 18 n=1 Tax=Malania oleifera TaxID=397392 RepID=UPI0025AEBAA0|nr:probable carboxylesterase 18 [Malania oleifera]
MTQNSPQSPELPWRTRFSLAAYSMATDLACRPDGSINRFFMNLVDFKAPPSSKPYLGVSTSDVTVDASRNLWFRLYVPSAAAASPAGHPVIVYFHGGGFSFLAANSKPLDEFCRKLARELPAVVISLNYRLAPEHRCPSQYEDGFDALKFIDGDNFPDAGDPGRCFLAGDSAGGNLAHHVAVRSGEHEFRALKIVGLLAIQPFFGGEEVTEAETRLTSAPLSTMDRTHRMWKAFLPDGSDRDHPAANVFGPRAPDISRMKFPATVVIVGGFDPLQDWQRRYYEGLKRIGKEAYLVEYPNAIHGFYGFPELPELPMLIAEVKDFVGRQLGK